MRNLTFKAAMLNDSRTTVNRQSTDGQSQRHYKQTPLSKRWKVLMTLVFLFTFAIGNVWGADYLLINDNDDASTATLNTTDFWTAQSLQAKSNGGSDYKKCIILGGNISAGVTNINYPSRYISYGVKTTNVTITIKAYQSNNSAKKINIYEVNEAANGALTVTNTKEESVAKGLKTITFTASPAAGTRSTIYITSQAASYFEFYQVTASETGSALTNLIGGRDGYSIDYSKKSRLATKSGETAKLDGVEYNKLSADYKPNNGTVVALKTGNYIKFNTIEPIVLTIVTTSAQKFYVAQTADGTTNEKAAAATHKIKLTPAGDWYIVGGSSSATNVSSISFSVPSISYDANGGEGSMSSNTWTVAANGFTAPSGKKFDGWKDADNNVYTVGQEVLEDVTLYAQWKDDVAEYTVTYKDGGTTLKSVNVAVGSAPDAYSPTKDLYTFAAWQKDAADYDPADLASDAATNDEITLTARWTAQYTSGTYEFTGHLTMGTAPNQMVIENNSDGKDYTAGRIDNIYVSAQKIGYEATGDYGGWKLKTTNGTLRFLVENACGVRVTLGEANPLRIAYTEGGVAKTADIAKSTTSSVYKADANSLVTLTNITSGNKTVTLKKIEILPLYKATYSDETGDASGSANSVTEVTLPTPSATTVGGYSFTGWVANQTVYDGETPKTAGEVLNAGGTYTLTATTTFTAQWALISDFDVKFFQGYGDPDAQIGETQSISTGNYATAPTDPERTGFAFLGWSYDGTEAHIVDVATYGITAETNFRAMWKAVWTVTFDGAGAVNVEDGETVASPNSPVMAGKVFQGWYNAEVKYDFSAAVTGNLALTSKWADADANHYYYNYKDDFHFDGVVYKTPEGKTTNPEAAEATLDLTTPYTLFSGAVGITSVVVTNGIYDYKKAADTKHVTSYLKINTGGSSKIQFTIATGYTAVLKMKMGGYSADPTITLKDAGDNTIAPTSGEPGGKKASIENNFNEIVYNLVAGTYTMTTATKTLYISHIDLEATALPTYSVTYKAGEGTGDEVVDANTYYAGDEVTLMANPFTAPGGKIWSEWSVKDGNDDDITVTSNKFIMPGSNVTVTAQWVVDNGMARLYRSDDAEDANSPYATLAEAVAAAQDGDKIVLQRNVADGAGIMLTKDDHKTLTIDFGGYTYTAVSPGVGSAGTQNQAFHLEKGNTVTLMNGTITSSGSTIKMLIQNYCDLTLENITLDGTGLEGSHRYVMSNNCGDVVIGNGTTITAKDGDVAFDVCATNYYPEGVTVTVKDGAAISGIVEYDVWGTKPADNKAELAIEGGDFDITWNVESALAEDAKENLNVSAGSFSEEVPVEYCAAGYIPAPQDPITNKYTVKEGWKVTFVDGEDEEIVAVDKNTPVAEKAMSDKIGYTFDGWFNGVDLYDFAANVTADLTLNAQWAAFAGCADLWPATSGDAPTAANQEITLQTGSNGGHIYTVSAKNDKFNESFEYTENGFALKKGGDDVIRVEMANDIVAGTKIFVTLKSGDTGARGLNLLTATGAKVKGGTKLGWDDATVGAVETFSYTVEAGDGLEGTNIFRLQRNNSVYLQCVRVESCGAAIVYHNLTSAVNIAGKGTVTLGATSVREGYTTTATYSEIDPLYEFVNWTVSGAGASVENATANPATITVGTEDAVVTLNLQLIPVKFTVNYYDGTTAMGTELVPVNEHPTASEIDTDKRHYTFQGWSETDGGSVVALNTITRTEATTVNLYAKYEAVVCPTSGTIFSVVPKPNELTSDYQLSGTEEVTIESLGDYATVSGGELYLNNNNSSNRLRILKTTSAISFVGGDNGYIHVLLDCQLKENDIIRFENSERLIIANNASKTGSVNIAKTVHQFVVPAAWEDKDEFYIWRDGTGMDLSSLEVYRPALFTVSFNLKGHGSAVADIENVLEGSKITAPAAPTDEDFAFAGWYKENTLENEWDFDNDVVSANTTLFAKWLDKSDATLKSLKYGTTDIELEDGVYEYEIALAAATASVPALTAVTNNPAANAAITNAAAFDGEGKATSTVEVTPQKEGAAHLTYTVKFSKLAALPQVNVTGSTTWNFSAGGSTTLTNQSDIVLANLPGINNDENFNSQALLGSFNKLEGNYFQGSKLSFTTEVPGKLTITFRGTNNHARHLQVCVGDGETVVADWNYNNSSTSQTKTIFVPEGKVTLKAFEGDVAQNARIYNMIFNATPDYTRPVTEGRYGTICLPNGGVMTGAELYEIAYFEPSSSKIFFDQIINGEMVGGTPYIFLPKAGTTQLAVFYTDGANADAGNHNGLYGSYTKQELSTEGNNYILLNNQYCQVINERVYVGENRAYIKMNEVSGTATAPAPGRRRISMSVQSEQVATGIENTGFESEAPRKVLINGELYIIRGEKMYDAKGQLVK